jgi:hypothetical protein
LCGHQWNSRSTYILQWDLSLWSTHEWIISKSLELTWVVWARNGCLVCFPNWHASQTFDIASSIPNLGRPPTRFCFSINLKRWRLTWPTCLC